MTAYTVGGLLAALKPAGYVFAWVDRAYSQYDGPQGDPVTYDKAYRLHKTDFMDSLKKLDPKTACAPYYVTEHTYMFGAANYERTARNVYFGSVPHRLAENVIQNGDEQ